jgi:hypothetical protein
MKITLKGSPEQLSRFFAGLVDVDFGPLIEEDEDDEDSASAPATLSYTKKTPELRVLPPSAAPETPSTPPVSEAVAMPTLDQLTATQAQHVETSAQPLPAIAPERRKAMEAEWANLCRQYADSVDNRLELLRTFGTGPNFVPLLIAAYEIQSLQRLVDRALRATHKQATETEDEWLDRVEGLAAHMVQLSHSVCPDLAGTLDYSTKWRRHV